MIAEHAALVDKMLASVEQSVLAVGWTVSVGDSAPSFSRPIGQALREVIEARALLDLCSALSAPSHTVRTQDLRRGLVPGGAISQLRTTAKRGTQLCTTTRDCTSGRRQCRRAFFGVRASTPRTCE